MRTVHELLLSLKIAEIMALRSMIEEGNFDSVHENLRSVLKRETSRLYEAARSLHLGAQEQGAVD